MIYQHPLGYLLGLQGVALLRAFNGEHDREFTQARLADVRELLDSADQFGDGVTTRPVTAAAGYRVWAEHYDEEQGHAVIGVDICAEMLAVAAAKVPAGDFRIGDLSQLPVPDQHVDLVICALALTHVADLAPVFAEFARVLRPDGHLVISDSRMNYLIVVDLGNCLTTRPTSGRCDPGTRPPRWPLTAATRC